MKPHLPLTLVAAIICAMAQAQGITEPTAAPKTEGSFKHGSAENKYSTDSDGTVHSTITGDWSGYTVTPENCQGNDCYEQHEDNKGIVTAMPEEYVNADKKPRVATNVNLVLGGTDENGDVIETKANRVSAAGTSGHIATGDKTVTVKEGVTANLVIGGYDLENLDRSSQNDSYPDNAYGHDYNAAGGNSIQHITSYHFPTLSEKGSAITINVEGGNIKNVYSHYISSNVIDKEVAPFKDNDQALRDYFKNPAWTSNEKVQINLTGGDIGIVLAGGFHTRMTEGTAVNITGGKIDTVYGGTGGNGPDGFISSTANTCITMSGGEVQYLYGGNATAKTLIEGNTYVEVTGGKVTEQLRGAGKGGTVTGNTEVKVLGGEVNHVYGCGTNNTVEGNASVTVDGEDAKVTGFIAGAGTNDTLVGDLHIKLLKGDIDSAAYAARGDGEEMGKVMGTSVLEVGRKSDPIDVNLRNIHGFDRLIVNRNSHITMGGYDELNGDIPCNVLNSDHISLTVNDASRENASITLIDKAKIFMDPEGVTFNITLEGTLLVGHKYKLIDGTATCPEIGPEGPEGWNKDNVKVEGGYVTFEELKWENGLLYLLLLEDFTDEVPPTTLVNWGGFKASQAFSKTLWGNQVYSVSLDNKQADMSGKGGLISLAENLGNSHVWFSAYGQDSSINGSKGADIQVYGGALGAEFVSARGRSFGVALGYDRGEVNPAGHDGDVEQESMRAALYGRAINKDFGRRSNIALDWAIACGNTTSSHDDINGDWDQMSWQLDLRSTYSYRTSQRTELSAFVGAQYYSEEGTTVNDMKLSGMNNLSLTLGGGISYALTYNTGIYGEVSVYHDILRDNPYLTANGERYYCSNPGRTGVTVGVGIFHRLNDRWSVRANYSLDTAKHSTEHNVNASAHRSF